MDTNITMNSNGEIINYMRYFMYSPTQMNLKREIQTKLGRELVLGTVIVKGEQKTFTEIITDPNNIRYSDATIVAYGDIREMKYNNPE